MAAYSDPRGSGRFPRIQLRGLLAPAWVAMLIDGVVMSLALGVLVVRPSCFFCPARGG